jgi:hypothetical protein
LILAPAFGCWLLAAQLAGRMYDAMSAGGGRNIINSTGSLSARLPPLSATATPAVTQLAGGGSGVLTISSSRNVSTSTSTVRKLLGTEGQVKGSRGLLDLALAWWPLVAQVLLGHAATPAGGVHARASIVGSAVSEDGPTGGPACLGPECFRLTFFILAALCGGAAVAAVQLLRRTRACYTQLLIERLALQ